MLLKNFYLSDEKLNFRFVTQGNMSYLQDDEENSAFSFETDHLALKGNTDYLNLLQTLVRLESIKVQSLLDIETLYDRKKKALENPLEFSQRLVAGQTDLPVMLEIPPVPKIDWSKYNFTEQVSKRQLKPTSKQFSLSEDGLNEASGDILVRGRIYKNNKPRTFNQPWKIEEQRRLEELLVVHPTEEIEMERWKKIATELGNRTPVQVQSRVQKYFLKLQRAGLPIPGRPPPTRSKNRYLKPALKKKFSKQPLLESTKRSTFLTSVVPTIRMDESEDTEELSEVPASPDIVEDEKDEDEEWSDEAKNSDEYKLLQFLKKIKTESENELENGSADHPGFVCNHCSADPILGTRWSCKTCSNLDLCNDCVLDSGHDINHDFFLNR